MRKKNNENKVLFFLRKIMNDTILKFYISEIQQRYFILEIMLPFNQLANFLLNIVYVLKLH